MCVAEVSLTLTFIVTWKKGCWGSHYLPLGKPVHRSRRNRMQHGTTDWFKTGKGLRQGHILSPCLFNLYQSTLCEMLGWMNTSEIKNARRKFSNFRYADDTTLMAECEEELKSLLIKVKEENGKGGLKVNILKTKIMASSPITWCQIDGEKWKLW